MIRKTKTILLPSFLFPSGNPPSIYSKAKAWQTELAVAPKVALTIPTKKENNVENQPTLRGNKLPKKLQKLELRRGLKKMPIIRPSRIEAKRRDFFKPQRKACPPINKNKQHREISPSPFEANSERDRARSAGLKSTGDDDHRYWYTGWC